MMSDELSLPAALLAQFDAMVERGDILLAPPRGPEPTLRGPEPTLRSEVQELRDGAWRTVPVAERHPGGFVVTDRRRAR